MKNKLKKFIEKTGYTVVKNPNTPHYIKEDKKFNEIYNRCEEHTMVSIEASFALYEAIKYISKENVSGSIVECGVWRGGQMMIAAHTLLQLGKNNKELWLYDTYTGMSEPTELDIKIKDKTEATSRWKKEKEENYNKWCYSPLEEVKRNICSTKYPFEKIMFIKGKIEDTIPGNIPQKISLLRLDTDWYESTIHELNYLYPLLEKKGVLIVDDYGTWRGAKKAVDEYMTKNNINMFFHRIGDKIIGIKT